MGIGWRDALAGAAVLFLAFLVLKLRPVASARARFHGEIRAARQRAQAATGLAAKAEAYCEAGRYARQARRYRLAAVFFLRAMKVDPTSVRCVELAASALERHRPRLLEKVLWRRLSNVPWDDEHGPMLRAAAHGLHRLYARPLRDGAKAEVMAKLESTLNPR